LDERGHPTRHGKTQENNAEKCNVNF